jgi:hypothetical protein
MALASPIRTRFNDDGAGTVDGWLVAVMLQLLLALPATESVAVAVKLLVAKLLGTPVTAPVVVLRVRPGGSVAGGIE